MDFDDAGDDAAMKSEARSGGEIQRKYEIVKAIYFAAATGTTVRIYVVVARRVDRFILCHHVQVGYGDVYPKTAIGRLLAVIYSFTVPRDEQQMLNLLCRLSTCHTAFIGSAQAQR